MKELNTKQRRRECTEKKERYGRRKSFAKRCKNIITYDLSKKQNVLMNIWLLSDERSKQRHKG